MIELQLGERWVYSGNAAAIGNAVFAGHALDAQAIAQGAAGLSSVVALREYAAQLNGCFALAVRRGAGVFAAVDRLRSIPLFYAQADDRFVLGDRAQSVREACRIDTPNRLAATEFYLTGYATRAETLFEGLYQLRAGEALWHTPAVGTQCAQYYRFEHDDLTDATDDELIEVLHETHRASFERLLASAAGKTLILPLSGGYDSRLIAAWLAEFGVKPVCYTYGLAGNWESKLSKQIAQHFGFPWYFVPYSGERWRAWARDPRLIAYKEAAGNSASIPHLQDWPAVLCLRDVLPADGVFVPGHTGDFITGGHVPEDFVQRKSIAHDELLEAIYRSHYSLWDWPTQAHASKAALDARIEASFGPRRAAVYSAEEAAGLYELWEWQERQAKFICNSVRVYESFGFDWRLPLYDHAIMDFWSRVPLALRAGRKLYLEYARRKQSLPVGEANRDRKAWLAACIGAIDSLGLRPAAKRAQYRWNQLRWAAMHANCDAPPLGWLSLVDRELFRRTYTGRESLHSYLARMVLDRQTGLRFSTR